MHKAVYRKRFNSTLGSAFFDVRTNKIIEPENIAFVVLSKD
jgi:hypothetical protein